ncbi:MAG: ATP-binding cassette domain-containing protein [Gammaproteobacteria bacterium]|nr:ATP-binding cassette domain-containing protein [Gammaproteobacteria bacterium]MDH3410982.1 ATP-binding cassette domain-containing protein [Gammaproteobacteria bacterium]
METTLDGAGIEIEDLHYAYGAKKALDGVSLSIRRGRFTAVLGPNGAGKSTLFSLLCGLIASRNGRIRVLGFELSEAPRAALLQMGIVFQQPTLDLDLSVAQNMTYFGALRGLSGKACKRRAADCLQRMGLNGREREKARDLNGGHRRRLEIARTMLCEPSLLLLDEPTVGLDVPSRAALVDHVHELCIESRLTVLWATHLVDEVWPEDDLVVLHQGQVRAAGAVREVLANTGSADVNAAFAALTAPRQSPASAEAAAP